MAKRLRDKMFEPASCYCRLDKASLKSLFVHRSVQMVVVGVFIGLCMVVQGTVIQLSSYFEVLC